MRTHPSYSRVRTMITAPEIPRLPGGGLALCHFCQRAVYFAGGFVQLLIADVQRAAYDEMLRKGREARAARDAAVTNG